ELQRDSTEAEQRWQGETARLKEDLNALRRSQAELEHALEEARGQLDAERLALRGEAGGLGEKLGEALRRAEQLEKEQEGLRQERDRLGGELADARAAGEQAAARLQAEARAAEELRPQLHSAQRSLEEAAAGRDQARQSLAEQRQLWDAERAA